MLKEPERSVSAVTPPKVVIVIAMLMGTAMLTACAQEEKRQTPEYRRGQTVAPLELPPDLASQNTRTTRKGDTANPSSGSVSETALASEQKLLPDFQNVKMLRDGSQRWLVVENDAENVWPAILDFWQKDAIKLVTNNPQTGLMETDWLENLAEVNTQLTRWFRQAFGRFVAAEGYDKFRVRIDRGEAPGTTEVFLSHRRVNAEQVAGENRLDVGIVRWEAGAGDRDIEAEMLRLLMVHLGIDESESISAVAQAEQAPRPQVSELVTDDSGVGYLKLKEPFPRAWRRVGIMLDRVGFTIEDRDRTQGVYYLRSVDPEAAKAAGDKNWVKRLFGRKRRIEFQSQVLVKDAGETTQVMVETAGDDGEEMNQRILQLLHEQLEAGI